MFWIIISIWKNQKIFINIDKFTNVCSIFSLLSPDMIKMFTKYDCLSIWPGNREKFWQFRLYKKQKLLLCMDSDRKYDCCSSLNAGAKYDDQIIR